MWTRPFLAGGAICALVGCNPPRPRGDVHPDDTVGRSSDVAITASIRRQLLATDALSAQADGIRIRTVSGAVTLRGLVETESDRDGIVSIAEGVTGVHRIDDQLEVLDGEP